jgi:peptide methionine sulfoxide reductase MsrB
MSSILLALIVITSSMPPEQIEKNYLCKECDYPLFTQSENYDIGNEWLSFSEPMDQKRIYLAEDHAVLCSRCGHTLGHLFYDGPLPSETRYSINPSNVTIISHELGNKSFSD